MFLQTSPLSLRREGFGRVPSARPMKIFLHVVENSFRVRVLRSTPHFHTFPSARSKKARSRIFLTMSKPLHDHLAFSSSGDASLIFAKERRPFHPRSSSSSNKKALLNVEVFGSSEDSKWPYLLFVPGVCESAETWTVQRLARAAVENEWRLAVLELEGHGLSTGRRAVCGSFSRLVEHVVDFVHHIISGDDADVPFVLCGASLGGVLAAYASDRLSKTPGNHESTRNFLGAITIVPAVGVAAEAVPPSPIVSALRVLATIAPSSGFLTPVEDPSHYSCPANSERNFNGSWPLATSRMLLDVTSTSVERDQKDGRLMLDVPALLCIAGEQDNMIPYDSVKKFISMAKCDDKTLITVPKADHGLMVEDKTARYANTEIFSWLKSRLQLIDK